MIAVNFDLLRLERLHGATDPIVSAQLRSNHVHQLAWNTMSRLNLL
jgi:hypothetical protein